MVYHKAISQLRQQSIRQRVNTVFYEQMQDMLHDIDLYQIKELAKHIEQAIKELPTCVIRKHSAYIALKE